MRTRALRLAVGLALLSGLYPGVRAWAADRVPVAVLWMGEPDKELGERLVEEVNAALARKQSARPIDSADDRRVLAEGGPAAKATALIRAGEAALARTRLAEAATAFEAAEAELFGEVPFDAMRARLAEVERGLLVVYDQLGRPADAARAAARLRMTPGSQDDLKVLLDRHAPRPLYGAALPPVEIVAQPAGAQIYRDLLPIGPAPHSVDGGDRAVDFVDVEAPGYRRAHVALGAGGRVELALTRDERLGVLVDRVRDLAPDAPPADVAALGKRVGAARVLAIMPDGPRKVLARWLDVGNARWSDTTLRVDNAGQQAMERLAGYAAPAEPGGAGAQGAGAQLPGSKPPADAPPKKKLGMWGKWYTWVAAAGVVALVVGLLVAQNVGDDEITVKASH